mmetsp:Transcript_18157/g.49825  ORF Transcript_18157/g.49825 Transcript_18157/m.49825 type:complete len:250 (+) Transcript_18157:485-1234(+)
MGATRSEARRALQEAATTGERAERCGNAECLGVAARNVGAASAAPEALRGEGASSDACLSSPAFHTASTSSMGRIFVDVCSGESTKIVSTRWMSLPIMPSASSSLPRIRLQLSATPWSTQAVSSSIVFFIDARKAESHSSRSFRSWSNCSFKRSARSSNALRVPRAVSRAVARLCTRVCKANAPSGSCCCSFSTELMTFNSSSTEVMRCSTIGSGASPCCTPGIAKVPTCPAPLLHASDRARCRDPSVA